MVKTLKNLLLQNQESFEAESWYIALLSQILLFVQVDDRRLTFDLLWQGQICRDSTHLYGEKVEKSFFFFFFFFSICI